MKRILMLTLILLIGGLLMGDTRSVDTTLTFDVNAATTYLEIRPNSNKNNNTLTHTQLLDFLDTLETEVASALSGMYDINRDLVTNRLTTYQGLLDGLSVTTFQNDWEFYYGIYEGMFELYSYTLESRSVEGRGIWHRPFERNLSEVRATLAALHDMGINMLYVETFWGGRLIYDSDLPGTFQHPFTLGGYTDGTVDYGTDLLEAFVEEGKAYGIEVHAWVENFFVGYGTSPSDSPILNLRPEWALYNYDGSIVQKLEINYIFMDPANPDVRDYVKAIYGEIAGRFDIASIHLDYIRYPVVANTTNVGTSNRDNGYSAYAEREFKSLYGYTGDLRTLVVTNAQAAADWKEYKTQVISDFVAGVYYTVKHQNPDVYLSTAIFGNLSHALETKMQDWASWIDDGLVELILPMAYYQSSITVRSEVGNLTNIVDSNAFSYAGIAPSYMGYNDHLNTTQIEGSLNGNAMGVAFFATQNYLVNNVDGTNSFNTKVQRILQEGVFRNEAILPHADTALVVDTILDDILSKADRIYQPLGAMTSTQRSDLATALNVFQTMPVTTSTDLTQLITALTSFDATAYAAFPAHARMDEDIQYLIDILTIKVKRMAFDASIDISVNPDPNTYFEELVELDAPVNLRQDGAFLRWDAVTGSVGYTVNINDTLYVVDGTSFDLRTANLRSGINVMGVYAMGNEVETTDSPYGNILQVTVTELDAPNGVRIEDDVLSFDEVDSAVSYEIHIGTTVIPITETTYDLSDLHDITTTYEIEIVAVGDGYATLDSDASTPIAFHTGENSLQQQLIGIFTGFLQDSIHLNQEEDR